MSAARDTWSTEHSIEPPASPTAIWSPFRDVDGWSRWNAGVEHALTAQGPEAGEIGPAIAADFPEVLAALVALAAKKQA